MADDKVVPLRPGHTTELPPTSMTNRAALIVLLARYGPHGMTWAEVGAELGLHHGAASGLLSRLHQDRTVIRLLETRNGQSVYVLPDYGALRPLAPPRRKVSALTTDLAEALRAVRRDCVHIKRRELPHPTCKWCEVKRVLDLYDHTFSD